MFVFVQHYRYKLYQALKYLSVGSVAHHCFIAGFDLFMGFVDTKINIEYHQTYSFKSEEEVSIIVSLVQHSQNFISWFKKGKVHVY